MNRSRLFAKVARHCFSPGTEIGTDRRACRKRCLASVFCGCTILAILAAGPARSAEPSHYQEILDRSRQLQDVPGISAVVIRDHEVLYAGGSGVADIATGRPVNADTLFYIGSMTKVLTSVLTLSLVEQEQVRLQDSLRSLSQGIGLGYPHVSILELLAHTSGLEREGNFGYWFNARFPDRDALSAYLLNTSLRFEPGANYHYSNIGYAALGLVVESITGESYERALESIVLRPLGMRDTSARGPVAGIASGYSPPGRLIPSETRPFAGVGQVIAGRYERNYHDAGAMSPAFGAYSTARDMGRLSQFLLGKGGNDVLSLAAREAMRERQPHGRGLGVGLVRRHGRLIMSHGGWFAAHRSQLLVDAHNRVAVVVLANSDNAEPGRVADALYDAALSTKTN